MNITKIIWYQFYIENVYRKMFFMFKNYHNISEDVLIVILYIILLRKYYVWIYSLNFIFLNI